MLTEINDSAAVSALKRSPLFSEELGIARHKRIDREYLRWFLASRLFGARVSATIAARTYQLFARHRLLSPRRILDAGWDYVVKPHHARRWLRAL